MAEIIQFPAQELDSIVCVCGSHWFSVTAVAFDGEGKVKARTADAKCIECGKELDG